MTRPARVIIDHKALHHNIKRIRQLAPHSKLMPAVKANAYGHGIVRISKSMEHSVDGLAVACVEEALQLRDAGIHKKILILQGPYDHDELKLCAQHGLDIVVHHVHQIALLEKAALELPVSVWLKIDTGMHRLGIPPDGFSVIAQRLNTCQNVAPGLRYMTHFACSEEPDKPMTGKQIRLFNQTCGSVKGEKSLANSAAIIGWPASHGDWVRPGIMLYGVSPMVCADNSGLQAVMGFYSEIIAIRNLCQGDSVGYGSWWRCPEDMQVGIVAAGYGDGYPRHIAEGTPILVNGQRTHIIGTPAMDMIAVDLRSIAKPHIGSPVELWGPGLSVHDIAKQANTISYELLCSITQRVTMEDHGKT